MRGKMEFKRILQYLLLTLMPIYLVTGCGDLEPEMQDTRTVILKMDFNQRSSSRSSQISPSELSTYKTHFIMAQSSGENLHSSYWMYYSRLAEGLMDPSSRKITLEIPLNTQMRVFAFLFTGDYSHDQLFSAKPDVGLYGKSQPFSIGTNTNSLSLGITLQSTGTTTGDGTGTDNGTDNGTDTGTGTGTGTSTIGIVNFDQGVEYMTACTTSYPSNTRKSVKFLSANTLEYTISPVTYQNASDCTNKVNGTRTAYSFIFNYATTPTYTVSNQEGQTGLTAYYGTWALSSSPSSPTYWMLIYPKDTNEFWIGFGTDESSAKALNMLYGGDGSSIDNKYTK